MSIYKGSVGICYIGAGYKTIYNTQKKRAFYIFGCRIRHESARDAGLSHRERDRTIAELVKLGVH